MTDGTRVDETGEEVVVSSGAMRAAERLLDTYGAVAPSQDDIKSAAAIVERETACSALLEALETAMVVVDECYAATGHVKVSETSVQREKVRSAIALARGSGGEEQTGGEA